MPKSPDLKILAAKFSPFSAGDSVELRSGEVSVTVESAEDKVSITSGVLDITRDAGGLALAQGLMLILTNTVQSLEAAQAAGSLPVKLQIAAPTVRPNPFQ